MTAWILPSSLRSLPDNLFGLRDAALLILGFAGAFPTLRTSRPKRRDIECAKQELVITVRPRSKTHPEGRGRKIAIPYGRRAELCPVCVLEALARRGGWRSRAGVCRHGS